MVNASCILQIVFLFCSLTIGSAIMYLRQRSPVTGAILGFCCFLALNVLHFLCLLLKDWWRPHIPTCKNGTCEYKNRDYKFVEESNDDPVFICRCGCHYKYLKKEKRLVVQEESGALKPYMHHTLFGRWKEEDHGTVS